MNNLLLIVIGIVTFAFGTSINETLAQGTVPPIHRDIYLHGEVNDALALAIGAAIQEYNEQGSQEIVMHISSYGGSVYAGLQIYDYMHSSKAPIKTICEGSCMSMAAYLLSWGNTRQAYPNATIMFHQVHTQAQGSLHDVRDGVLEAQRLQDRMNTITMLHSGLEKNTLIALESFDDFMSPEIAKKYGLIDTIIGE
jgi:ATP-dependent Clp protease protease subunit